MDLNNLQSIDETIEHLPRNDDRTNLFVHSAEEFEIDLPDQDLLQAEHTVPSLPLQRHHVSNSISPIQRHHSRFLDLPADIRTSIREVVTSSNERLLVSSSYPKYFADAMQVRSISHTKPFALFIYQDCDLWTSRC